MKGNGDAVALLLLSVTACAFWPAGGQAASEKTYQLQLTGEDGARFAGNCTLGTADSETVIPLDGQVPYAAEFVGQGLACKLETKGRVVVDIEHGGSHTRSATSGGMVNISLN